MLLLLAILLAFLAQNLITPSHYDFIGVCAIVISLAALLFAQRGEHKVELSSQALLLAGLVILLIIAWQILPLFVAVGVFLLIACALFVQQCKSQEITTQQQSSSPLFNRAWAQALIVILILLAAFTLSVYDNEHILPGFHGDEGESGIEARNLNAGRYNSLIGVGWYDQPLPSFLVQAVGLRLFGDSVSGLRTTSAVVSLLTLPLVYLLAHRLFGARVAFITLVLMAFAHWYIAYARLGINYNQTTLFAVLAILGFWEGWQRQQRRWFVLSGLATGAGSYLYFASRLVPILLLVFTVYVWIWQRIQNSFFIPQSDLLRRSYATTEKEPGPLTPYVGGRFRVAGSTCARLTFRQVALWLVVTLLVFLPMGPYFIEHAKEFNSRAAMVFLFDDPEKMKTYTGSADYPTAFAVQVYRYTTLFNAGGDRSGQYGTSLSLLEYYTATFFVLGLAYALYHARQPRYVLLLLWLVLTVFIGGVLTIESPFSPRLVGVMPVPFMLAAIALDRGWTKLDDALGGYPKRRLVIGALAVALIAAVVYDNYWSYFDHYIHTIDGWAQREPATVIARYAAQLQPDQTMYVLGAPQLYVWHGTIRFIAPNLRGYDLLEPDLDLPIRDPVTKRASFVIVPSHLPYLEKLKVLYPHGVIQEYRRAPNDLWFLIDEVPAEDIEAGRK